MVSTEARTPLYDWHAAHQARMVQFAGWMMPIQYTSIVEEHVATRRAVGLFDISHMGRLRFDGHQAAAFLDRLVTRHVARLHPGQIAYSLVTNDQGGILDDVLVYHLEDAAGTAYYLMVVNAGNREKIVEWFESHRGAAAGVDMSDVTFDWAMIAVQGPGALQLVGPLVAADLAALKYYTGLETAIAGHGGIVSRTGYTGEDGVELIVGARAAQEIWETLLEASARSSNPSTRARSAGLGCRDTLRLEAGMPLYGHELSEDVNPFQAGLGFAVDLDKGPFPGRDRLVTLKEDSTLPRRVGLELDGRRVPRQGFTILARRGTNQSIGQVTSGTFSPTFERPIAMGYVLPEFAEPRTEVQIDIRGHVQPARVVNLPFYRRSHERKQP